MREIDNLVREAKEVYSDLEEHRRERKRLARKARKFANKVQKRYPDFRSDDKDPYLSLHEQVEDLAKALHLSKEDDEDPVQVADFLLERLFAFLRHIGSVSWSNSEAA